MNSSKWQAYPMLKLALITSGFIASLVLITILWKQNAIEVDLIQRTRQALDQLGFLEVQVQFNGRDGVLFIPVNDEKNLQAHLTQLKSIDGVRDITTQIQASLPVHTVGFNSTSELNENGLYIPSQEHPLERINLTTIRFNYAQATLTSDSFAVLNKLVIEIKKYSDIKLEISAHTDNSSTALGNLAMSQARAQTVVNYLINNGINPEQLVAVGYGSSRPIATNTTRLGRATNQRIALTVLKDTN
ncbi:MAG: hypothetical protein RLZZ422_527 [Pseudomonadota bacterium]|jgi:outer membrane protein OmpA-like peptidoglycan-associated protein